MRRGAGDGLGDSLGVLGFAEVCHSEGMMMMLYLKRGVMRASQALSAYPKQGLVHQCGHLH